MATSSLYSIGSGLDIPTLVANLVAAERAPAANRINAAGSAATAKVSALGTIKAALDNVQKSLKSLATSTDTRANKTTVPEGAGFTATAGTGAATGSYNLEVISLAASQKLTSAAFSKSETVGEGQLSIGYGSKTIKVDIAAGHTISDVAKAINESAAGKGVTASVVNADDGQHLVLTALDSGTAGKITVTATGESRLPELGWNGTSGGLAQTVEPKDAVIKVDGYQRTSSSNTLIDVIPNVTLVLSAVTTAPKTMTISQDNSILKTDLQALVTTYNALQSTLKSTSAFNVTSGTSSALTGDSMVRNMQKQLRDMVGGNVADLKSLGVTIATDGTLTLDTAAFDTGAAKDPTIASRLFGAEGALTKPLNALLDNNLNSTSGVLTQRTTTLNKEIKRLELELDNLDMRMEKVSDNYTKQFTAMDTLVAQMQKTSDTLTQQLASLSSQTK